MAFDGNAVPLPPHLVPSWFSVLPSFGSFSVVLPQWSWESGALYLLYSVLAKSPPRTCHPDHQPSYWTFLLQISEVEGAFSAHLTHSVQLPGLLASAPGPHKHPQRSRSSYHIPSLPVEEWAGPMEQYEPTPPASHSRDLVSFFEPVSVTLIPLTHSFGLENYKLDTTGCSLSVFGYC